MTISELKAVSDLIGKDAQRKAGVNATVTMYKENAHWCYVTKHERGSFGSSLCGTLGATIEHATSVLRSGDTYRLIVNNRDRGVQVKA